MLNRPATSTQITHLGRLWLYVVCGLVIFFLIAPTLLVIPMSFSDSRYLTFPPPSWSLRWYRAFFGSVEWRDATVVSFQAAFWTMVVSTITGTMAAYGLHTARLAGGRVIQIVLALPMMIPVILIAIGVFIFFAPAGLNNTVTGLVLAHSTLAIPLVLIAVTAGLKSFDMNQEMVARSMGATRLRAFLTVTMPQIRYSVISGALLAFITSLDEVVISLLVAGGESATLTRRMFLALRDEIDPTIAAISTLLILVSIVLVAATQLLQSHRGSPPP
jgi:putative spermidine/putrescine transport system permease protein